MKATKKKFSKLQNGKNAKKNRQIHYDMCSYLLVDRGRMEKDPSLWASVLGKDTKRNLRSYPWQKQDY